MCVHMHVNIYVCIVVRAYHVLFTVHFYRFLFLSLVEDLHCLVSNIVYNELPYILYKQYYNTYNGGYLQSMQW